MAPENACEVAYLGLGSSLGDRIGHLAAAVEALIRSGPAAVVTGLSPVYESPHLGLNPEDADRYPAHLNAVVRIETSLSPVELLGLVHSIERADNRDRTMHWGPRTIDIDILAYSNQIVDTEDLKIPHPGVRERAFVLMPLADLAPSLRLSGGHTPKSLVAAEEIRKQRIKRFPNRLEDILNERMSISRPNT